MTFGDTLGVSQGWLYLTLVALVKHILDWERVSDSVVWVIVNGCGQVWTLD